MARPSPAAAQVDSRFSSRPTAVVLNPGDKVQLKIWREPDLSGEFLVDQDGIVVLPHIGRLEVGRLSTDSLRALLISRLSESLRDPAVEVTVLRRVAVLGSVRNPGLYYVDPTITVAGVLALAGGVSPDGNQKRLELRRGGERLQVQLNEQSSLADSPVQPGDQLWVPERSWLSRNTWLVSTGIGGAALIIAALLRY
jgi:protein involved in polysaccharide export with SLBB domain